MLIVYDERQLSQESCPKAVHPETAPIRSFGVSPPNVRRWRSLLVQMGGTNRTLQPLLRPSRALNRLGRQISFRATLHL